MRLTNAPDDSSEPRAPAKVALSLRSQIGEMIRALFLHSANYMLIMINRREVLLHKDQLIELMELGNDALRASEVFKKRDLLVGAVKLSLEDVAPSQRLLILDEGGLSVSTFQEYRENKLKRNTYAAPSWWEIPLPLIALEKNGAQLNPTARELIKLRPDHLARLIRNTGEEKILSLVDNGAEHTYSLLEIEKNIFFLEDISGDFDMAEDLVWWAATGRALVKRLEENGLAIHRYTPFETPRGGEEVIPCIWDGDLIGKLGIRMPDEPVSATEEPAPVPDGAADDTRNAAEATELPAELDAEPESTELPVESNAESEPEPVGDAPEETTLEITQEKAEEEPRVEFESGTADAGDEENSEQASPEAAKPVKAPARKRKPAVKDDSNSDESPARARGTKRAGTKQKPEAEDEPAIADGITTDETSLLIDAHEEPAKRRKSKKR